MTAPAGRALRTLAWAAAVAAAAAAGWWARGPGSAPLMAASAAPAVPRVIAADARTTRPAELPTVERAITQLAAPAPAPSTPATGPDRPEVACAPAAPDAEALLQAIARAGDEGGQGVDATAGADALLSARAVGVPVPDALLRELIERSPSDRTRLAALDSWLEARVGDPDAERAALESLLGVPNAAVQHERHRRLVELEEMARLEALAAYGVAEPLEAVTPPRRRGS